MPRLKNKNAVPSVPVDWRDPATKTAIRWNTATEPFHAWVGKIWEFCDGNQRERPTAEALEELACSQFPHWVCDGNRSPSYPKLAPSGSGRATGCASCGGRARYV